MKFHYSLEDMKPKTQINWKPVLRLDRRFGHLPPLKAWHYWREDTAVPKAQVAWWNYRRIPK